jgi:hypothetical protein
MYFNLPRVLLVLVSIFALQAVIAAPIPDHDGDQHCSPFSLCGAVWKILPTAMRASLPESIFRGNMQRLPQKFKDRVHDFCSQHEINFGNVAVKDCMAVCIRNALEGKMDPETWEPHTVKTMNELGVYQLFCYGCVVHVKLNVPKEATTVPNGSRAVDKADS